MMDGVFEINEDDELDFRGEKWGAGESRALEAKRTRCSRSVRTAPPGSMDGERRKRAPGIVTDDLRFRAGGNGGDGERCAPSPSELSELELTEMHSENEQNLTLYDIFLSATYPSNFCWNSVAF